MGWSRDAWYHYLAFLHQKWINYGLRDIYRPFYSPREVNSKIHDHFSLFLSSHKYKLTAYIESPIIGLKYPTVI